MMKAAKRAALPKRSYEVLADFRFALRQFFAFSEQAAAAAGLSPQQYQGLLAIKGAPGRSELSIQEIADRLMVRHHTAVELVNRLARNGFVERKKKPEDQRRVLVNLTAKAERVMDSLAAAHLRELKGIRPALGGLLAHFD
jgi:DNA-binding MarR family transcriptional regulator